MSLSIKELRKRLLKRKRSCETIGEEAMKAILTICSLILLAGVLYVGWRVTRPDHHGRSFRGAREVQIAEIVKNPSGFSGGEIRIKGKIVRQCPAAGCWFYLDDGNGSQMGSVTPQLPQNIGRYAAVEGQVIRMGDEYQLAGEGVEFSKK